MAGNSITLPAAASKALDNLGATALNVSLNLNGHGLTDTGSVLASSPLVSLSGSYNGGASGEVDIIAGTGAAIYIVSDAGNGASVIFLTNGKLNLTSGSGANITLNAGAGTIRLLSAVAMGVSLDMGSALINNLADPVSAQDAATKNYVDSRVRVFTSNAGTGGAATQALTVTGLLSTDTIIAVTQKTPGANNKPLIGFSGQADNSLTANWGVDPGAGAIVVVTVIR